LADDLEKMMQEGFDYIFFDYPFGYMQKQISKFISLSVFLDTPLDIAMARRLLRNELEEKSTDELKEHLEWYLKSGHKLFELSNYHQRNDAELIVDGRLPTNEICNIILDELRCRDAHGASALTHMTSILQRTPNGRPYKQNERSNTMKNKFYITTAIAYTSQKPHIGNTYEVVFTDAIARFKRAMGYDVFFLTGTDEHGQKIEDAAREASIPPKEYVDNIAGEVRRIWDLMDSSYDKFIRTTDDYHEDAVSKIFLKMYEKGDIYKGWHEGNYCKPCEAFFSDSQLSDGKCPDCLRDVTKEKEEAYIFKISKYADRLAKHIEDNPDFIEPVSRKNEMVNNFIKPGLKDLCISRSTFSWGIPVPVEKKHIIYVWLDALSNYITALGYMPDGQSELFDKYWPCDVHVIGKDILRFHTIYWPIFLMSLDLPLPKKIFGHPWLLSGTDKMSKSSGNTLYADDLVELFGLDAVRYYLLAEMPYANDGGITYERFIVRYNSDLANTLGNLVNRTVAMTQKYFDGVIPAPSCEGNFDADLKDTVLTSSKKFIELMDGFKTADALSEVMNIARRSNKYIDETTPWVLAKNEADRERLATVLYNLIESIRFIGVLLTPVIPQTSNKIFAQINAELAGFDSLDIFGATKAGTTVGAAEPLFNRIDEQKKLAEIKG